MNARTRFGALAVGVVIMVGLAACQPLAGAVETGRDSIPAESVSDEALATVTTRSLRVRALPAEDAEVIAGVREGETYRVLEISSDGEWVRLAVPAALEGNGWVAANLISINGTLPAAAAAEATATPPAETTSTVLAQPEPGYALVVTDGTRLRVRSEPTLEGEVVGYVYNGESYAVLGVSEDGAWIQIAGADTDTTDNPEGGWIATEFAVIGE